MSKRNAEDSDDSSDEVIAKQSKKTKSSDPADGLFELGSKKKVSVQSFKGNLLVHIREYYVDKATGEEKPGSKGIALTVDQYKKLKEHIAAIDDAIESQS